MIRKVIQFTLISVVVFQGITMAQVKQPADTSRQFLLDAAREIITSSKKVALITQDENGTPQIRTMDPFVPEEDFTVWLATHPNTRKVQQIKNNPNVTLYYPDKNDRGYVVIHGVAELVSDQKEKDTRWKNEWKNFYANRTDAYLLIKVTPNYLELINYNRGISGDTKTWQPAMVRFKE
jgi:general stress protein 26